MNNPFVTTKTIPTKHLFLDIIGYSHERSVEAQTKIIAVLNSIVASALKSYKIRKRDRILLPTGDGMCICFINNTLVYDVHIVVALLILEKIGLYNTSVEKPMEMFHIRIGINQNLDNLIIDINGNRNIAGAGINTAQRIMDSSDQNTILVGEQVFNELQFREKYIGKFIKYSTWVKHNYQLNVYHLVLDGIKYLNCDVPKKFITEQSKQKEIRKVEELNDTVQIFLCLLIKFSDFIRINIDDYFDPYYLRVLLYRIADCLKDSLNSTEFNYKYNDTFKGTIDYENKSLNLNAGLAVCKKMLGNEFQIDLANYYESLLLDNNLNKHFFDFNANRLKVNSSYIDEMKKSKYYPNIDGFSLIE